MKTPLFSSWQVFLVLFFTTFSLTAQPSKTDSLVARLAELPPSSERASLLNTLSRQFLYREPPQSVAYSREALHLADSMEINPLKITALQLIGYFHRNQGNFDSALYYFNESLALSQQEGLEKEIAAGYANLGNINNQRGNYEEARNYYRQSIAISEKRGDSVEVARITANMATTYVHQGDFEGAKQRFTQSLNYFIGMGDFGSAALIYNNLTSIYLNEGNHDTAFLYVRKTMGIYQAQKNNAGISNVHASLGEIHQRLSNFDSALYHIGRSAEIKEEFGDTVGMARMYSKLGNIYQQQGLTEKALEEFIRYLRISEAKGNSRGESIAHKLIGLIYQKQKNYDEAVQHFSAGLELAQKMNLKQEIANGLTNLGMTYLDMEEPEKALEHFLRARFIADSINHIPSLAVAEQKLGEYYQQQGQEETARQYFAQSLIHWQNQKSRRGVSKAYLNLGASYASENDFSRALENLKEAEKLALEVGDYPMQQSIFESLVQVYEQLGQPAQAVSYYKKLSTINDSLYNKDRLVQLAEVQTRFETEKQQAEIDRLETETAYQKLKSREQLFTVLGGSTALLLLLIGAFTWNRNRQRSQIQDRQLALEQERANREQERAEHLMRVDHLKDQFLANTSHELRTPLHGIIGISEALYEQADDSNQKENLSMIIASGKRLTSLVNDLLDFSKIKNQDIELSPKSVGIRPLVDVVLQVCFPWSRTKTFTSSMKCLPNCPWCRPMKIGCSKYFSTWWETPLSLRKPDI